MADRYVFDSNIFISLQRKQPIDIYPSLWKKIDELMAAKIIISSREVYDEIAASSDALSKWVKPRVDFFLPTSIDIQKGARNVLEEYRELVENGKKRNNADPFVISMAQISGCTVVTEEGRTNNIQAPKIPDVCDAYGIPCIDFVGFAREMKWAF